MIQLILFEWLKYLAQAEIFLLDDMPIDHVMGCCGQAFTSFFFQLYILKPLNPQISCSVIFVSRMESS